MLTQMSGPMLCSSHVWSGSSSKGIWNDSNIKGYCKAYEKCKMPYAKTSETTDRLTVKQGSLRRARNQMIYSESHLTPLCLARISKLLLTPSTAGLKALTYVNLKNVS